MPQTMTITFTQSDCGQIHAEVSGELSLESCSRAAVDVIQDCFPDEAIEVADALRFASRHG